MYPVPQEAIEIFKRPSENDPHAVVKAKVKTLTGNHPCSHRTARRWHMFWRKGEAVPASREEMVEVEEELGKIKFQESNAELLVSTTSETIQTPERLIEVSKVDLKLWRDVFRDVRSYQVARRFEYKDLTIDEGRISGSIYDEGNLKPITLFSVQVKFVPRHEYSFEQALDAVTLRIKTQLPREHKIKKVYPKGQYLWMPTLTDVHWGRLSVDGSYTPRKTSEDFSKATDALLGRALTMGMPIDRILLPVGNDAFNADTLMGDTTRYTRQEMSAGLRDVIDEAVSSYLEQIDKLLEVAPVDVVVIEGNHDRLLCYFLGKLLQERYALHPLRDHVTVDNEKKVRKYYRFGENLIGMEHGDRTKEERLPLFMAEDAREHWAATRHHTWFRGHFHEKKISFVPFHVVGGVQIYTLPSFCPEDQWEAIMGFYRHQRAAEGYFFHAQHGMAVSYPVFVDELA